MLGSQGFMISKRSLNIALLVITVLVMSFFMTEKRANAEEPAKQERGIRISPKLDGRLKKKESPEISKPLLVRQSGIRKPGANARKKAGVAKPRKLMKGEMNGRRKRGAQEGTGRIRKGKAKRQALRGRAVKQRQELGTAAELPSARQKETLDNSKAVRGLAK